MKPLGPEIDKMLDELKSIPKLYSPSTYWENLNTSHVQHIKRYGITNFKRSINREYFDWGVSAFGYQFSPILSEIFKEGNISPIQRKLFDDKSRYLTKTTQFSTLFARWLKSKHTLFGYIDDKWYKAFNAFEPLTRLFYKTYVAYLYDYVRRNDIQGMFKKLQEPDLGSPLSVKYRGNVITQDLCNSMHEFYSITKHINIDDKLSVAELGAGYGRLAYVFLRAQPKIKYCIIDIFPALYISQEYLRRVFPKEKIFTFRPFNKFKEVEKDFHASKIVFLMPHQIEYLPKNLFDVFVNISSLHEMRRDQIRNYIKQEDRLTRGHIYFKLWKKSRAKDNNFIQEDEYPIPKKWMKIYSHTHPIQHLFFEALYSKKRT